MYRYSYDRTVEASNRGFFWNRAEAHEGSEAKSALRDLTKELKKIDYSCKVVHPLYQKLADSLETPIVIEMADRIKALEGDIAKVLDAVDKGVPKIKELDNDVEKLCRRVGKEGEAALDRTNFIKELEDLPAYSELMDLADSVVDLEARLGRQEKQDHIDWTLDEYLGSAAGVYAKLQRLQPSTLFSDGYGLATTLYGFLKHHLDEEILKERAAEYLPGS